MTDKEFEKIYQFSASDALRKIRATGVPVNGIEYIGEDPIAIQILLEQPVTDDQQESIRSFLPKGVGVSYLVVGEIQLLSSLQVNLTQQGIPVQSLRFVEGKEIEVGLQQALQGPQYEIVQSILGTTPYHLVNLGKARLFQLQTLLNGGPDLDAIERRVHAATPGPWQVDHPEYREVILGGGTVVVDYPRHGNGRADANADLIVHAPTDLLELVATIRKLREIIKEEGL